MRFFHLSWRNIHRRHGDVFSWRLCLCCSIHLFIRHVKFLLGLTWFLPMFLHIDGILSTGWWSCHLCHPPYPDLCPNKIAFVACSYHAQLCLCPCHVNLSENMIHLAVMRLEHSVSVPASINPIANPLVSKHHHFFPRGCAP